MSEISGTHGLAALGRGRVVGTLFRMFAIGFGVMLGMAAVQALGTIMLAVILFLASC